MILILKRGSQIFFFCGKRKQDPTYLKHALWYQSILKTPNHAIYSFMLFRWMIWILHRGTHETLIRLNLFIPTLMIDHVALRFQAGKFFLISNHVIDRSSIASLISTRIIKTNLIEIDFRDHLNWVFDSNEMTHHSNRTM